MLTAEQLQSLKRTNISKDAEKTKQRSETLWKSLKLAQRDVIKELAGVSAQTIYKVYKDGGISIKVTLAFAQTLGINPYYLTGEADEPGECTGAIIRKLLLKHGYKKLVSEIVWSEATSEKRKYTRREKPEPVEVSAASEEEVEAADEEPASQLPPGSDELKAFFVKIAQGCAGNPDASGGT